MNPVRQQVMPHLPGDKVIWTILLVLSILSMLAVYSATGTLAYQNRGGDTEYFLLKQSAIILFGLVITFILAYLPYSMYGRFARVAMWVTVPLLLYALFFGVEINQARRWILIPFVSLTFQASDVAKLTLLLFVARQMARMQDKRLDFNTLLKPVFLPVALICGLIAPANLSTALLLFATVFIVLFIARIEWRTIGLMVGVGVAFFALIYLVGTAFPNTFRAATWTSRVQNFVSGEAEGYQITQAKIAMASGGFFGEGPGNSYQRNLLPSSYSDFIYAIFIEEYGFVGGVFLILLYLLLLWRCVRLVTLCDKAFGVMLVMGMSLLIVLQAMANVAVAVGLTPVTGVTLPFMSMGGTSLIFFSMAMGMILSVSRYVEKQAAVTTGENPATT